MSFRIEDFSKARTLIDLRAELLAQLQKVGGEALGVTIHGRYQDDDMLAAVRPSVLAEITRRIAALETQLKELGMEI